MTSGQEIRDSFLDFFKDKTHTVVQSSSLVPVQDPTLLFTNAGMVQFKNIFLGVEQAAFKRAASAQKCLRISGKHNDLEVGGTGHLPPHLFRNARELVLRRLLQGRGHRLGLGASHARYGGCPRTRLYATVFRTDDEAEELWHRITGLPPERVQRFDEKDNFWEMGDTGPCGPCSEIHLDRGPEACDRKGEAGHVCAVNGDWRPLHRALESGLHTVQP